VLSKGGVNFAATGSCIRVNALEVAVSPNIVRSSKLYCGCNAAQSCHCNLASSDSIFLYLAYEKLQVCIYVVESQSIS
jgi:hypothetical protein